MSVENIEAEVPTTTNTDETGVMAGTEEAKIEETKAEDGITEEIKPKESIVEEKVEAKENGHATKVQESNGDRTQKKRFENKGRPYERSENKSKYDASILPPDNDPANIRTQVEFYFGDSNLPKDKHLWGLTKGTHNEPVPVSEICKFGRMKRFGAESNVVAALKDSEMVDVVQVNGQDCVKRKFPCDPPEETVKNARSIYAKGFGEEGPGTQFDVEAYFSPYGPTREIRLRRTDDTKLFKGSVFVEFQDVETRDKFLALDPMPLYKGKEVLDIKSKLDYMDGKLVDIREGRLSPKQHRGRGGRPRGGNRGNNRDRHGDRDPDDWKKRREDDRASGFKDNHRRGGKNNYQKNGRRGRGGRDGRNNDRNRNSDRNGDRGDRRDNRANENKDGSAKGEVPENTNNKPTTTEVNEKKRAREEDGFSGAPEAKKVDTKSEAVASTS